MMAKSSTTSQSLMAATKSAVNKAKYYTTKEKKALALKLVAQVTAEVEALEVVVPKAKTTKSKPKNISKMTKAQLIEVIENWNPKG